MKDNKELTKWQAISFISRGLAQAFGIVGSFVILRVLTKSEWGIVQIGVALGAIFGIYQHFGLASGSTREISAAKDDTQIFKIFITAIVIRYIVTIPISVFLLFASNYLAVTKYSEPGLILPIRIYAVVLLVQGVQSIFNSVISGTQRFKQLFVYQSVIALVNTAIFIPFVYFYKINGYFYALLIFNIISSVSLGIIALRPLKCKFTLPEKDDYRGLVTDLLSISLAIYFVKILYTFWEKSGPLLLGLSVSKELVGTFTFAMLYAKKLLSISDAVTDVSLPVFSEKYVKDFENFKFIFSKNFNKIFVFILFSATTAVFWASNILRFAVGGSKYDDSFKLILPIVFAFIFYSFINIVKSSVIIPARMIKEMVIGFSVMLASTVGFYFIFLKNFGQLPAMSLGMLVGGLLGFFSMTILAQYKLKFSYFNHDHVLLIIQALAINTAMFIDNLFVKAGIYVLYTFLFVVAAFIARFVEKEDFVYLLKKVRIVKI